MKDASYLATNGMYLVEQAVDIDANGEMNILNHGGLTLVSDQFFTFGMDLKQRKKREHDSRNNGLLL